MEKLLLKELQHKWGARDPTAKNSKSPPAGHKKHAKNGIKNTQTRQISQDERDFGEKIAEQSSPKGPKKTGRVEARLKAMEQQVFKCQGMVERGLNANPMMITEVNNKHKIDANDIGKHLSRIYDRIDHLQA
ncbi:40s ribosomal protein s5-1 [Hordeum vulgare]|nr:40s ribosomal protein s5-1 [Hordeum vulgare]